MEDFIEAQGIGRLVFPARILMQSDCAMMARTQYVMYTVHGNQQALADYAVQLQGLYCENFFHFAVLIGTLFRPELFGKGNSV